MLVLTGKDVRLQDTFSKQSEAPWSKRAKWPPAAPRRWIAQRTLQVSLEKEETHSSSRTFGSRNHALKVFEHSAELIEGRNESNLVAEILNAVADFVDTFRSEIDGNHEPSRSRHAL